MIVAVFDPGGTTGYCVGTVENSPQLKELGEFKESSRLFGIIERCDLVVCEQLTVGRNPGFNPIGIEVMGAVKAIASHLSKPITMQRPSVMQFPLKWGCIPQKAFPSEHTKDAVCHYVAFLASVKIGGENVITPSKFQISLEGVPLLID